MVMGSIASPLACLLGLHGCRRAGPSAESAASLPPGIISSPVALSWVVSVGRAELFAAWFRALAPGSGPVLRFHAYASASVLLLALFFFPAFPILFPSLLQSGPSIGDAVTDQKT
jgi:hypothetical protein